MSESMSWRDNRSNELEVLGRKCWQEKWFIMEFNLDREIRDSEVIG